MWEPNPLNFRTVRGCCRKIEKIEAKQSREKLSSAARGSVSQRTTCHFHILTHHLLADDACWRTSFRPWSRFLHSDFCDHDNYSRTAHSLPGLPGLPADSSSSDSFIPLFFDSDIKASATFIWTRKVLLCRSMTQFRLFAWLENQQTTFTVDWSRYLVYFVRCYINACLLKTLAATWSSRNQKAKTVFCFFLIHVNAR